MAVEVVVGPALGMLQGVKGACLVPAGAAPELFAMMEADERRIYDELGGRFVDTERTMESLTSSDSGEGIRRAFGDLIEFGTSVWYARFQTTVIGPETSAGGMARPLPLAIMRASIGIAIDTANIFAAYITRSGMRFAGQKGTYWGRRTPGGAVLSTAVPESI